MIEFPFVDTPTSKAAAVAVDPNRATTLREQVFDAIKAAGSKGLTDEEIQEKLHIPGNTERPRRWELSHKEERITDNGTRLTRTGRKATVWVV